MGNIIKGKANKNGTIYCELICLNRKGMKYYQAKVFRTIDFKEYIKIHRSYPSTNKIEAINTYVKYCEKYLRN